MFIFLILQCTRTYKAVSIVHPRSFWVSLIYIYFFFRKNVVSLVSLNSNYLLIQSFWPSWLLRVWFHDAHRNAHRRGVFMSTDCNIKINM